MINDIKYRACIARVSIIFFAAMLTLLSCGCEKEKNPLEGLAPSEAKPTGKREYGEIKPVILQLPDGAVKALGGADIFGKPLKEVQIYFRSLTIVVYQDTFDVKNYIDRMASAFDALAAEPQFTKEADAWAIQIQGRNSPNFVTIGCTPKEVAEYGKSRVIDRLFEVCDYLMINDVIISKPGDRLDYYNSIIKPSSPTNIPKQSP